MSRFDPAIEVTFAWEGGWSNDARDPGGLTRYGISSRYHPNVNLAELTREGAKAIYERDYWTRHRIGMIEPQEVATKVLDMAVVLGPRPAIRCLQRALRSVGVEVTEDGLMGPETAGETNHVELETVLAALRSECAGEFRVRIARNPLLGVYERGWLRRAYS